MVLFCDEFPAVQLGEAVLKYTESVLGSPLVVCCPSQLSNSREVQLEFSFCEVVDLKALLGMKFLHTHPALCEPLSSFDMLSALTRQDHYLVQ